VPSCGHRQTKSVRGSQLNGLKQIRKLENAERARVQTTNRFLLTEGFTVANISVNSDTGVHMAAECAK
jgi:hypothetical protein